MSIYALQKAVFDHMRRLEDPNNERKPDDILTDGYSLTETELAAASKGDISAFHALGVHPVLINGYARANGWKRADYKQLFTAEQIEAAQQTGVTRWQKS